jgi:hypothetical protein
MAMHHDDDDDDGITPKMTVANVRELRAVELKDGREYHPGLPTLRSNAKQAAHEPEKLCRSCRESRYLDSRGYHTNRELARKISALVNEHKKNDKDGSHFILEWRLYPNKDHPRFKETDGCGCGCGQDSLGDL